MKLLVAIDDKCIKMQFPRQSTPRESISAFKEKFNIENTNSEDWSFNTPSTDLTLIDYEAVREAGKLDLTGVNPDRSWKSLFKVNPSTSLVSIVVQPPGMCIMMNIWASF